MGFHDVQFPTDDSYGLEGGSGFNTSITQMQSGAEEAVSRWGASLRTFDASRQVRTRAQMALVEIFWQARQGSANRFRYKDWRDYASTADGATTAFTGAGGGALAVTNLDQNIGTGTGSLTTFQLVKKYTNGSITRTRNITRPVAGTTVIALAGVNQPTGWTVDTSTGIVTFTVAPTIGVVVTAGFEFDIPSRFGLEIDKTGIRWKFVEGDQINADTIPIDEVPEGPAIDDEFYYGDSKVVGVVAASFAVNLGLGRAQLWTVNTASLNATMPDATSIPDGFPMLAAKNDGSQSIQIKRSDGTNEFSIAAGATAMFALITVATVKRWYAF